jgi:tetratricopeptide (TPR) repeat protein
MHVMIKRTSRTAVLTLSILTAGVVLVERIALAQSQSDCDKYYEEGDYKKAKKYCDGEIASATVKPKPGVFAKRASIFLIEKKFEEGVKWIETVAETRYPGDPLILEQKAALLIALGRPADAVKVAEVVVAKDRKRFIAQKILGDYYSRIGSGKAKETIKAYEAYMDARPEASKGDGIVMVQLGFAYMHIGKAESSPSQYKKAEDYFDKALKSYGGDDTVSANAQKGKCTGLSARAQLENNPRLYDQAITVCEAVIKSRKGMRGDASPFYNVGIAYLNRNQLDKAVAAANSYIQQKPNDYRGYLLRGKIYFAQQKFNEAEGQFNRANEIEPNNTEVALARGKNFRRQRQTAKAIALLEKVAQAKGNDPDVLVELSRSYLENNQNKEAATTAEKALGLPGQAQSVPVLVLAGDAYLKAGELGEARKKYSSAYSLNKQENRAKTGLIETIVKQSFAKFEKGDLPGAQGLLNEALGVDADSTMANFNLGVIALDQGRFQDAVKFLNVRAKRTPNDLITNRLLAKAYMNLGENGKALDYYAKAETAAKELRNNVLLAEIYTEWAPLILAAGNTENAVERLEIAEQYATNQPFAKATQRNLQVAYFRRGYERWRARKTADALQDLEGAVRYPANLTKAEEDAFTFALGLAYLSANQDAKAVPIFQKYSKLGILAFLKPPWDKIGADFFMAYAWYREETVTSRRLAATAFEKLLPRTGGAIAVRTKQLLRSAWEYIAWESFNGGSGKDADAALAKADAFAAGNEKRNIDHNRAVIALIKKQGNAEATFTRLGDDPPEALVNLGIIKDQAGDAKAAYQLWTQARAKGVNSDKLNGWIEAKKRIFNF